MKKVTREDGLSIVIVSYNSRHVLPACLDSLLYAGQAFGKPFEIIIVDNKSKDGTVSSLKDKYNQAKWLSLEQNLGFGVACNRGANISRYSLLLFLNPDTLVEQNTFQVMWDLFAEKLETGVAGCRIRNPDHSLQLACRRSFPTLKVAVYRLLGLSKLFPKSKTFGRYNLTYMDENRLHEVDAVSGSFLCIRHADFKAVKGFDENFFIYGEDLDLCYRVKKAGKKNYYTPETSIIHFKGESAKSIPFRARFHFYSAMIIFSKKHFELRPLPLGLFYLGVFLLAIINFFHNYGKKWQRWSLDLVLVNTVFAAITASYAQFKGINHIIMTNPVLYAKWHLLLSILIVIFVAYSGDYGKTSPSLKRTGISITLALLSFFSLGYFFYESAYSRIVFGISGIISHFTLFGWRLITAHGGLLLARVMGSQKRTVIIGVNRRSLMLRDLILQGYLKDHDFLGFVPEPGAENGQDVSSHIICDLTSLPAIMKRLEINNIIIAVEADTYQMALKMLAGENFRKISIKILVDEPKPGSIILVDLNYSQ